MLPVSIITILIAFIFHNVHSLLITNRCRNYMKPCSINKNNKEPIVKDVAPPKKNFQFKDLIQLIAMGAGAPGLGEFDRVDPETGKLFFKLDANNLVDSKGESVQMKAKFFQDGYVEGNKASGDFDIKPPGFWSNLISGGKLQEEWEDKIKNQSKQ